MEGRNGPEIQEGWVHSALTPNPLGRWENSGTLFSTALQFCGCSLGPGRASLEPPVPPPCRPPWQGCPWNPPLDAAILPAMDFPAAKPGKGWQQLLRVAGGNCSSSGSPKRAFSSSVVLILA